MRFLAKTFHGLEEVLAQELRTIGAGNVKTTKRGVLFEGSKELMYKVCMKLRTALTILTPIAEFEAFDEIQLYKKLKKIEWENYIGIDQTFSIKSTVKSEIFGHSKYVVYKMKDAIADWYSDKYSKRPSVDTDNADVQFNIHINQRKVIVSLDCAGAPLYKRGYRSEEHKSPLNEVLAAGIIYLSGWTEDQVLYDPMCGSGTLLIEAASMAVDFIPNKGRDYCFENWPDFDEELFKKVYLQESEKEKKLPSQLLFGSDKIEKFVEGARINAKNAGFEDSIEFECTAFEESKPPKPEGIIIMNPPYDLRFKEDAIFGMYRSIGDTLKQHYTNWEAWILSANLEALKHVGLKTSKKIVLYNGALECRLVKYELYQGSKKQ